MTANATFLARPVENPFRAMRLQLGLSQELLSELSSVALETILAAEIDPVSLPLHELSPLANYLNLDPGNVFEYLHEKMAQSAQKGQLR